MGLAGASSWPFSYRLLITQQDVLQQGPSMLQARLMA